MLGSKRPDANACRCLSCRIPAKDNVALAGTSRGELVERLCRQDPAPGFARNRKIPQVDGQDVWCIRVRPGHRGRGISHSLLAGAVEFARGHSVPEINGFHRVLMRLDLG